jgi:hypothetical protein
MDKCRESGTFEQRTNCGQRILPEVDLELGLRVRSNVPVTHGADENQADRVAGAFRVGQSSMQPLGGSAIDDVIVDVGMVRGAIGRH